MVQAPGLSPWSEQDWVLHTGSSGIKNSEFWPYLQCSSYVFCMPQNEPIEKVYSMDEAG